jgi:diguanylate cyclase (GGDEF)-like protein
MGKRGERSPAALLQWLRGRYREWPTSLYRHNLAVAESKRILRATSQFVALSCLVLSVGSILLMMTPGGADTPAARVATSVVAVAGLIGAGLWWSRGWPRERASYLFVASLELGHGIVLFSCSSPVVSLLAATWFFLIGDYLAFAHGRPALFLHCTWVGINLLYYGTRAMLQPDADIPLVVFVVVALTVTLIVTRLFAQLFADALRSDSERSAELAHRDPLTQLLNRRGLDVAAPRMFGGARSDGGMIAVLLIDIDRFKLVNDLHGHLKGDEVLTLLSRRLANSVRRFGLVARTGGEEFVILDRVHPDGIRPMAERLRRVCQNAADEIPVSVSVGAVGLGAADFPSNDPHVLLTNMIIQADAAMYAAKLRGGNQVVLELPGPPGTAAAEPGPAELNPAGAIFDTVLAARMRNGRQPVD